MATEVSPIKVFGLETCSWQEMQEAAVKRSLSLHGAPFTEFTFVRQNMN